jgi:hypothetical protein
VSSAVIKKHVGPDSVQIENTPQSPIGVCQWKVIIRAYLVDIVVNWHVIPPGIKEIVRKIVIIFSILMLICRLKNEVVINR